MQKSIAIKLLGPTTEAAGKRVGCSGAAIRKWPAVLPPRLVDRVIAASVRMQFDQATVAALSSRITLHPDLFSFLCHEQLMARTERARKLNAEEHARRVAEPQPIPVLKRRPKDAAQRAPG